MVGLKFGFRATHFTRLFPDAPDTGPGALYEIDTVEQVGDQGVASLAGASDVGERNAGRQGAGADHLNSVDVHLNEDVRPGEMPVPMHNRVGDGLAKGLHRILLNVLPLQPLNPVFGAGVAIDEGHGVFDVGHDSPLQVAPVQDVHLVVPLPHQAGDERVGEETADVFGEEQHPCVAEQQLVARPLRRPEIDQRVFHGVEVGDAGAPEPVVELCLIKVFRVLEARAEGTVEIERALRLEETENFVSVEFLRHRSLPCEKPVPALHRLYLALAYVDRQYFTYRFLPHLHRRVAFAGDVPDAGSQGVGIRHPGDRAVVVDAQQDRPALRVRQGGQLPDKRGRKTLFELQQDALALPKQNFQLFRCHFALPPPSRSSRL